MLEVGHKLWNFHLGGSSLLEGYSYLRLISHFVRFINMLRFATWQYLDSGNEGPPKRFQGIPLNSCEAILWGAGTTTTSIATSCRSFQGSRYLQRSHQKTIENMFFFLGRKNHFIATNNHRSLRSSEKTKRSQGDDKWAAAWWRCGSPLFLWPFWVHWSETCGYQLLPCAGIEARICPCCVTGAPAVFVDGVGVIRGNVILTCLL